MASGALRFAGDAQDPRGDGKQDRGRREPEAAARLDGEDPADRRPGLAVYMAAAHQVRPEQVRGLLEPGEHGIPAAHVLIEAQLAARPQDPAELGERGGNVGHRAQQAGDDDRVEFAVSRWQFGRGPVGHPDRHRGGGGRLDGPAAQVRLGLDGHDLAHRGGIVREVQAVARADLHDPAR